MDEGDHHIRKRPQPPPTPIHIGATWVWDIISLWLQDLIYTAVLGLGIFCVTFGDTSKNFCLIFDDNHLVYAHFGISLTFALPTSVTGKYALSIFWPELPRRNRNISKSMCGTKPYIEKQIDESQLYKVVRCSVSQQLCLTLLFYS